MGIVTKNFSVYGMSCAACVAAVEKAVKRIDGVSSVSVSLLSNSMTVIYDENKTDAKSIVSAVISLGYGAEDATNAQNEGGFSLQWTKRRERAARDSAALKRRLIASVILLLPLMYISMGHMLGLPIGNLGSNALVNALIQLALSAAIIIINGKFYRVGVRAALKGSPNMDTLVTLGSFAAFAYGVVTVVYIARAQALGNAASAMAYAHKLYFESGAMIVTLVTLGKFFEGLSKSKTAVALDKLISLSPKTATVVVDGVESKVLACEVRVGDVLVIKTGETIPVDGVITEGSGYVDQAAITGESLPVEKSCGDTVICATVNKNGWFKFRANKVGEDTSLAKIIKLVDEAGSSKAPIQRLADKISGIFVPCVVAIALITFTVWLLVGSGVEFALSNAISVLVISCPCALGLATPVAVMVATGRAAELGILIKSAESLEALHSVDTVVMDKTGTLTEGKASVTDAICASGVSESDLISLAAAIERGSEHPLALAIIDYAERLGVSVPDASGFNATFGKGVSAEINGKLCLGGSRKYMLEKGIAFDEDACNALAENGKTAVIFAVEGKYMGALGIADGVRTDSVQAVNALRKLRLSTVMLTGDNAVTARAIQRVIGVDRVVAEVLPEQKEAVISQIQAEGGRVAMVGDGINDAVALTRANVGIAIGGGTEIAVDSADVVLMKNSIADVVTAINLSKATVANVKMNLFWAFFYNAVGIPIAAGAFYPVFGWALSPMLGSAAMSLSSVCVVLNALRLRFFGKKKKREENKTYMTIVIKGMTCAHCQAHVEKALAAVAGVTSVKADYKKGVAALVGDADKDELFKAVVEAGYTPVKIK